MIQKAYHVVHITIYVIWTMHEVFHKKQLKRIYLYLKNYCGNTYNYGCSSGKPYNNMVVINEGKIRFCLRIYHLFSSLCCIRNNFWLLTKTYLMRNIVWWILWPQKKWENKIQRQTKFGFKPFFLRVNK